MITEGQRGSGGGGPLHSQTDEEGTDAVNPPPYCIAILYPPPSPIHTHLRLMKRAQLLAPRT